MSPVIHEINLLNQQKDSSYPQQPRLQISEYHLSVVMQIVFRTRSILRPYHTRVARSNKRSSELLHRREMGEVGSVDARNGRTSEQFLFTELFNCHCQEGLSTAIETGGIPFH